MYAAKTRVRSRAEGRRRGRQRSGYLFIVVLCAWYVALGLATRQPEIRIRDVRVTGGTQLTPVEVEAEVTRYLEQPRLGWWYRDNVVLLGRRALAGYLHKTFPALAETEISYTDRTLVIEITEYEPVALWCWYGAERSCLYMNEDGVAYGAAPEYSTGIYTEFVWRMAEPVEPPYETMPKEVFHHLRGLEVSLSRLGLVVSKFERVNQYDVRAYLDEQPYRGAYIVADYEEIIMGDWEQVLTNINTVLQSGAFLARLGESIGGLEYLDARLSDKIYYRFRDATR